jgi:hypothetical protein
VSSRSLLSPISSFGRSHRQLSDSRQTEAVYTLLTRSATAHHLADLRLDEPSRLAALIAISQLRVKAAGHPAALDAERSLSELESAWAALLALDQGGGDSVDGGQVQEGELLTRAREAKAKLEITACSARGESVSLRAGLGQASDLSSATGCSSHGLATPVRFADPRVLQTDDLLPPIIATLDAVTQSQSPFDAA